MASTKCCNIIATLLVVLSLSSMMNMSVGARHLLQSSSLPNFPKPTALLPPLPSIPINNLPPLPSTTFSNSKILEDLGIPKNMIPSFPFFSPPPSSSPSPTP
ncbi:proline-rich receptor-like protein kinase PERK2 [Senna tora]|uniref:Proline-rich receptor-like protein kinase PERK2 n=1 Tax=Senna tora TaxID=362788 RepID=A0A835CL32_9FABA|nr:proline-rich receptor-like protein kinase PERK2 [Senna tora]